MRNISITEKKERNVQGAFGNIPQRHCEQVPEALECFEDCLVLYDIEGVTYEGKPLSHDILLDTLLDAALK